MATITRDIIGSTLSINSDFRNDKAQRRVFVKLASTDTGGTTRAGTAILKAIENQSSHPENGCTAPLRSANARQIGADTFEVTLDYYHERARFGNSTTLFTMKPVYGNEQYRATVYKEMYNNNDTVTDPPRFDAYGLPNGKNRFPTGSSVSIALGYGDDFYMATYRLLIDGKINAGLAQTLEPALSSAGSVNNNAFTYGGIAFPANCLLFESATIDHVDEEPNSVGGLYYYIRYAFRYCPNGFVTQRIKEQTNGVAAVETGNVRVGPLISFAGLFPGI